jgi:uncharacterized PurR-regulated membrane protein YhhQ (DUF165 family)
MWLGTVRLDIWNYFDNYVHTHVINILLILKSDSVIGLCKVTTFKYCFKGLLDYLNLVFCYLLELKKKKKRERERERTFNCVINESL